MSGGIVDPAGPPLGGKPSFAEMPGKHRFGKPIMEPTRPKPRPDRPSKSPDDRKVPVNNNYSLLIIVVVVCAVLAALFLPASPGGPQVRPTRAAHREGGPSDKNKDPSIDVPETQWPEVTVRYSNLSNLQVGPNEITGKVTPKVISPEDLRRRPRRTCRSGARATGWIKTTAAPDCFRPTVFATSRAARRPTLGRTISCSSDISPAFWW